MIPTKPSVQKNTKHIHVCRSSKGKRKDKQLANRRHRKALNMVTQRLENDPEKFDNEGFNAPSFSDYDID